MPQLQSLLLVEPPTVDSEHPQQFQTLRTGNPQPALILQPCSLLKQAEYHWFKDMPELATNRNHSNTSWPEDKSVSRTTPRITPPRPAKDKREKFRAVVLGKERTLPKEPSHPLSLHHLLDMKFSLHNSYIQSHFNRHLKANRYMGLKEQKTWST